MLAMKLTLHIPEKVQALMERDKLLAEPVTRALKAGGLIVERRAKEKAAVDTGRLRASIASEMSSATSVSIGSVTKYAPYVEFGTRPHFPPLAALQPWARRHGFPAGRPGAYLVARAIAARGTRPQPFLVPALKESAGEIDRDLRQAADEIERRWEQSRG